MATEILDRILEEVRSLSDEEKAQLREELDNLLGDYEKRRREEAMIRRLQADGIVSHVPSCDERAAASFRSRKPVEIQGKPLSETIIEERR